MQSDAFNYTIDFASDVNGTNKDSDSPTVDPPVPESADSHFPAQEPTPVAQPTTTVSQRTRPARYQTQQSFGLTFAVATLRIASGDTKILLTKSCSLAAPVVDRITHCISAVTTGKKSPTRISTSVYTEITTVYTEMHLAHTTKIPLDAATQVTSPTFYLNIQ